jgi:hypothetical protein
LPRGGQQHFSFFIASLPEQNGDMPNATNKANTKNTKGVSLFCIPTGAPFLAPQKTPFLRPVALIYPKSTQTPMPRSTKLSNQRRAFDEPKNSAAAQIATKPGARLKPLIPLQEDVDSWLDTLTRWYNAYLPDLASPHYRYVVNAAREDWFRTRAQNDFNTLLQSIGDRMPTKWTPAEIKRHDQAWRFKDQADMAFHRSFRMLTKFYQDNPPRIPLCEIPVDRTGKLPQAVECKQVLEEPLIGLALWENTTPIN